MKTKIKSIFLEQNISFSYIKIAISSVAIVIIHFLIPDIRSENDAKEAWITWINASLSLAIIALIVWLAATKKFEKIKSAILVSFVNYLRMHAFLITACILILPFEAALFRFMPGYDLKSVSMTGHVVFALSEVFFLLFDF